MSHSRIRFCIICPAWNCQDWVYKSISSILAQRYEDYRCIFIDDFSSDDTLKTAEKVIADDARFTLIGNTFRMYPLANIINGTNLIATAPEDIIVILDADDWFSDEYVLTRLAKLYTDPDLWLTYGSCELARPIGKLARLRKFALGKKSVGQARRYPRIIREKSWYRYHPGNFLATHLRSYRNFLWKAIRDEDMRDESGSYFKAAADVVTMFPMLEMATEQHLRFLPDILYVYNNEHNHSEHKQASDWFNSAQYITNVTLRSMPPYDPLSPTIPNE